MKLMVHKGTSMPQNANLTDTSKRVSPHGGVLSDMHGRIAAIQDNRMLVFLRPQDVMYAKWNMTFLRCSQAGFLRVRKPTGDSISWFSCDDDLEGTYRDNPTDGHCDPVSLLLQDDKPAMSTHTISRPLGTGSPTAGLPRLTPVGERPARSLVERTDGSNTTVCMPHTDGFHREADTVPSGISNTWDRDQLRRPVRDS